MASKPEDFTAPASDIPILIKVERHFIAQREIRSVSRSGKGCKIVLVSGEELVLKASYDKVSELVK